MYTHVHWKTLGIYHKSLPPKFVLGISKTSPLFRTLAWLADMYFGKTRAGSVSASLTPPRRLGLEASYSVHCLSPFPLVSCTLRQVCKILPRNSLSPPKASGHSAQLIDTHFLSIPLVLQTSHCTVLLQTSPQGAISPSSRLPPSPAHSLLIS